MSANRGRDIGELDVSRWLDDHGDVLFRYALRRVATREVAEDLVQETFVSALDARQQFAGRANVQTWLVSILRRKIIDYHRREAVKKRVAAEMHVEREADSFFTKNGHWRKTVRSWPINPQRAAEDAELWEVFEDCQTKLPAHLAEAFQFREIDQMPTDEICNVLEISASNLGVRLHRARLLLRECLEQKWFDKNR